MKRLCSIMKQNVRKPVKEDIILRRSIGHFGTMSGNLKSRTPVVQCKTWLTGAGYIMYRLVQKELKLTFLGVAPAHFLRALFKLS